MASDLTGILVPGDTREYLVQNIGQASLSIL